MPSVINSDNGVISGTSGLKTSGSNDGLLDFQSNGTTVLALTGSGISVTGTVTQTGVSTFAAGTAAAPAITFTGDTNTGIYSPGADRIGFAEGGVQCGEFDASGNFQFNSGYGSVATAYGCRAWVNFNGAGTLTGTYSQSGTTMTVTVTNHGLSQGQSVYITFQTGAASAEAFTVTSVTSANIFVVTSATSRTTSGNCTLATIIRASGNVSSITDNGTGDYTVNFTTAMPDANYSWGFGGSNNANDTSNTSLVAITTTAYQVAGSLRILAKNLVGGGAQNNGDSTIVNISVFR